MSASELSRAEVITNPMRRVLDGIKDEMDRLKQVISNLTERLSPVLTPETEKAGLSDEKETPEAPIVFELKQMCRELSCQHLRLAELCDRLAV